MRQADGPARYARRVRVLAGGDAVGACTHVVVATTLEDGWRMVQGTTTVISGPQRSLPIRVMTRAKDVTSIA